jgi:CRISPR-associated protein Csd1
MILQALKEYYDRMAADPESGIAPEGWEKRRFLYSAEIDSNGKFVRFHELKENNKGKQEGKMFLVPALGEKKGNGIKANWGWENIEYLFNIPVSTAAKMAPDPERVRDQHAAFCEKLAGLKGTTTKITALQKYSVNDDDRKTVIADPLWEEVKKTNQFIVLSMKDQTNTGWLPIVMDLDVQEAINNARPSRNSNGYCLITGAEAEIVRLEPAGIKGVRGSDGKADRTFVSFNRDPFCSYKKEKNLNSPIGKQAAFAYTTALNFLLSKESSQNILVGDASTIFWSAKRTQFESDFASFFEEADKDDPSLGVRHIKNLFESPKTGSYLDDEDDMKFFILGLSPNSARISVRFWEVGTVADFAGRIKQHFEDLAIVKPPSEPEYYSLWRLLVNTAIQDKSENIPPNIAGDFMRSILDGRPYSETLLQASLRRIHSDAKDRVKPTRAALIV